MSRPNDPGFASNLLWAHLRHLAENRSHVASPAFIGPFGASATSQSLRRIAQAVVPPSPSAPLAMLCCLVVFLRQFRPSRLMTAERRIASLMPLAVPVPDFWEPLFGALRRSQLEILAEVSVPIGLESSDRYCLDIASALVGPPPIIGRSAVAAVVYALPQRKRSLHL